MRDPGRKPLIRLALAQRAISYKSCRICLRKANHSRGDMVKYFGEQLSGYAFTQHGWVQSYGNRCVAPPIIWGDVARPAPMTVRWTAYAQSLTAKPVKGMLTGPVTMLCWSFVRDDVPREQVCRQIALALRDEVMDLERAGIAIVQVDELAFREGLPLRQAEWADYLRWREPHRMSARLGVVLGSRTPYPSTVGAHGGNKRDRGDLVLPRPP